MSNRQRVTWWLGRGPAPAEFREIFVAPFNACQEGIELDLTILADSARDQTVQALADGAGPDLVMVPRAGDFLSLVESGYLADLSGYAAEYGWPARLLAPAMRLAAARGGLFGLPRSSETMLLLSNREVLNDLRYRPPRSLSELERAASRALRSGVTPFGAGCGDMPESSELLWTLIVNHYAGPRQVRHALLGEVAWTSPVFADALELLISWFDRGWFGTDYFTQPIEDGLRHLTDGSAAMSPAMTGMLPAAEPALEATPFPALRAGLPSPLYVFGTGSLIGINAATAVADSASRVLDALFTPQVRRRFSARVPGDWNIPLADADADALCRAAPDVFCVPSVGPPGRLLRSGTDTPPGRSFRRSPRRSSRPICNR